MGTPGRLDVSLAAESVTVHARTPVASTEDLANHGGEGFPMMTKRHEQPVADRQLKVNNDADSVRLLSAHHDHCLRRRSLVMSAATAAITASRA